MGVSTTAGIMWAAECPTTLFTWQHAFLRKEKMDISLQHFLHIHKI
jgi:hypothetical protein